MGDKILDAHNTEFLNKDKNIDKLINDLSSKYVRTQHCFDTGDWDDRGVWNIFRDKSMYIERESEDGRIELEEKTTFDPTDNHEFFAIYSIYKRKIKQKQNTMLFGKRYDAKFLKDFEEEFLKPGFPSILTTAYHKFNKDGYLFGQDAIDKYNEIKK